MTIEAIVDRREWVSIRRSPWVRASAIGLAPTDLIERFAVNKECWSRGRIASADRGKFFVAHNLRPKPPQVNAVLAKKRHKAHYQFFLKKRSRRRVSFAGRQDWTLS